MKKNYFAAIVTALLFITAADLNAQQSVDATMQITTSVQKTPPRITFTWNLITGATNIYVYRKAKLAASWGAPKVLAGSSVKYVDSTVTVGTDYEYRFYKTGGVGANTYIYAGIELPVTEARGKLILLVDSTFVNSMKSELRQLQNDLVGDGWTVIRRDVNRTASVKWIKKIITGYYKADPVNVKAVYVFGHVPVPYSGEINPDGHADHIGAWPADVYYADIDSTYWTDNIVNNSSASRPENKNVPGDGKFDPDYLSGNLKVELQVGRVDLSNMPAFSQTEQQLLQQYLTKSYNYKYKVNVPVRRALIDDNFGYFSGEAFASSGWRNFTALFNAPNVSTGDYFTNMATQSYLWSYGCGGGSYTSAGGIGNTTNFTTSSLQSVFTMLFGSYFGDWDSQNNFLRAPLAANGWTLTNCWSGRPYWHFHHMGMGDNIGYSAALSESNSGGLYTPGYFGAQGVHMGFMGDPALRLHVVGPAANLTATPNVTSIGLSWKPSADTVLGYHAYSLDTVTGVYNRINSTLITGTTYTDASPKNGKNYYMVRALKLEKGASGTYFNLSQGIFDTASINVAGIREQAMGLEVFLYPNPANQQVNMQFSLNDASHVDIVLHDITGRQVKTMTSQRMAGGEHYLSFDVSELPSGAYFIRLDAGGVSAQRKLNIVR